jgi:hypothetical protein
MSRQSLLVCLYLFVLMLSSCNREKSSENIKPEVPAHITRLGTVLRIRSGLADKNVVFLDKQSASTEFITEEDVKDIEAEVLGSLGAAIVIFGDQSTGTFTVYTWIRQDYKLRLDIVNHYPERKITKSYYWEFE